ncbi:MAG: alpha/beta hydrolase [Kibdelosporangium sp.]
MPPLVLPHDSYGTGDHHVLVLHGWFGDRTSFRDITPHLDTASFTYVIPDSRGYGEAIGIPGDFSTDEVAGDALAVADQLGWESFSVAGHSMGGKTAQRLLTLAPDRVRKIVGISPVPANGAGFDADTAKFFADAPTNPEVRRAIIDQTTGQRLPAKWLGSMVQHSLDNSSVPAFAAYLPNWSTEDFHTEIDGNPVPALAIVGRYDPALSADTMKATWMRSFPNAELCVLEEAGHYAPHETPLALVAAMEKFLLA